MSILAFCKEYYRSHGYSFNNIDILFEDPKAFKEILKQLYCEVDEYFLALNDRYSDFLIQEYENITNIQKELARQYTPKLDLDEELIRYKVHYFWGDIISEDQIKNVYWSSEFYYFIELSNNNHLKMMVDLFNFDFKKLYGRKGFNSIIIGRIIDIFKSWCNKQISPNYLYNKNETPDSQLEDLINDVLDEFFK